MPLASGKFENCHINTSLHFLWAECTFPSNSVIGFQAVAQPSESSQAHKLFSGTAMHPQTSAAVSMEGSGLYQVTVIRISKETIGSVLRMWAHHVYTWLLWDQFDHECVGPSHQQEYKKFWKFAAKLTTGRWSEHGCSVVASLDWPLLAHRRQYLKICQCRKILEGISIIPSNVFTPAPTTSVRHKNSWQLLRPLARTTSYYSSYFVSITKQWNDQPDYIINCKLSSFKKQLKLSMCVWFVLTYYYYM